MFRWSITFVICFSIGIVSAHSETPVELSDLEISAMQPAKVSLAQVGENDLAEAGSQAMTEAMVERAKHSFVKLAANFKSDALQGKSIETVRLAQQVLLQTKSQVSMGDGLDLIFRKLNELKKKIEEESKLETADNNDKNQECRKQNADFTKLIAANSDRSQENRATISEASSDIDKGRVTWRGSRNEEDKTHTALVKMQAERVTEAEEVRARVDERNKAIDVMVKATFLVCDRFNRYKNTVQCLEIKSQPDIDEPHRYETKPYERAKLETESTHVMQPGQQDPPSWLRKWSKTMTRDREKEGEVDPEGLMEESKA